MADINRIVELHKKVNEADDEYLRLRDMKSNGYCIGWSIMNILAFDEKILAAHKRAAAAYEAWRAAVDSKQSERS